MLTHRSTFTLSALLVATACQGLLLEELRALPQASLLDWKLVEALVPFGGVRVEDDLVVAASGIDNLTRPFLP